MVSRNGFRFSLISYNILSQTLLTDHNYLYTNCHPKDLEWPRRGHRIVSELLNNRADIICLQEVESEHLQSLYQPKLARHGYECLYKKKTGYKIDGCAIFYKSKLFHLLNHKGIEFNRQDVTSILNRDNVGIIAVLKPKFKSQSQLVIANTHLIFNPKRSDIKLAQLKIFLSELDELSFRHLDKTNNKRYHHPTILCGDLNSVPESVINKYIINNLSNNEVNGNLDIFSSNRGSTSTTGEETIEVNGPPHSQSSYCCEDSANFLKDLKHAFQFKSVYPTKSRKGELYVSTFSSCLVDYIFYTPNLRLKSYRKMLTEEELKKIGPIPNSEFPSDHLSLEASFVIP